MASLLNLVVPEDTGLGETPSLQLGAETPTPLHLYLHEAADKAHIDFFCNISGFPDDSLPGTPPKPQYKAALWKEIFEQRPNYSRSGINE